MKKDNKNLIKIASSHEEQDNPEAKTTRGSKRKNSIIPNPFFGSPVNISDSEIIDSFNFTINFHIDNLVSETSEPKAKDAFSALKKIDSTSLPHEEKKKICEDALAAIPDDLIALAMKASLSKDTEDVKNLAKNANVNSCDPALIINVFGGLLKKLNADTAESIKEYIDRASERFEQITDEKLKAAFEKGKACFEEENKKILKNNQVFFKNLVRNKLSTSPLPIQELEGYWAVLLKLDPNDFIANFGLKYAARRHNKIQEFRNFLKECDISATNSEDLSFVVAFLIKNAETSFTAAGKSFIKKCDESKVKDFERAIKEAKKRPNPQPKEPVSTPVNKPAVRLSRKARKRIILVVGIALSVILIVVGTIFGIDANNKKKAKGVYYLLENLPFIDGTDEFAEGQIRGAEYLYWNLSERQRALVPNYWKLIEASENFDKRKANVVVNLIEQLEEVTLESASSLENVETKYAALNENQKLLVSNHSKLQSERRIWGVLRAIYLSLQAPSDSNLSSAVKNLYRALSSSEKSRITNYDQYLETIAKYESDETEVPAVKVVESLIDSLGEITLSSASKLENAEAKYNALTQTQKQSVKNYSKLQSERKILNVLLAIDKSLKDPSNTIMVSDVKNAYSKLSTAEEQRITNYNQYLDTIAKYEQSAVNSAAVKAVESLIDSLGEITLSTASKLENAEAKYNALNQTQKQSVKNYSKLQSERKILNVLLAIEDVRKNSTDENTITRADKLYSELNLVEQKRITSYSVLKSAKEALEAKKLDMLVFTRSSFSNGDSYYRVSANKQNEPEGDIVIPSSYNGLPVRAIGPDAFDDCGNLTSIDIPNSVTNIKSGAFSRCSSLTSITIPNSVTSIEYNAFQGCISLKSIIIPNSITEIGSDVFDGCSGLTSITIPNSVTSIESGAFSGCSSLASITIPSNVTDIGRHSFFGCSTLTSITIPNSVTKIAAGAFAGCASLKNINVNTSNAIYKTIDGNLYTKDGKTLLQYANGKTATSFDIPNSVTNIIESAFLECSNLTSITIPNSVTEIGAFAFDGCTSLTSITIPNSVTKIQGGAFNRCTSLMSITIPSSVTYVGEVVFYGWTSNQTIYAKCDLSVLRYALLYCGATVIYW